MDAICNTLELYAAVMVKTDAYIVIFMLSFGLDHQSHLSTAQALNLCALVFFSAFGFLKCYQTKRIGVYLLLGTPSVYGLSLN